MSPLWFNLRIMLWHFQIHKGDLFRVRISFNRWWWCWSLLWKPVWFHEFDLKAAWKHRGETHWKPLAQKGQP